MGVYIKGMEMPTRCGECLLAKLSPTGESLICDYMLSRVSWDERPFDCPLVPVPPHGDLIDRDALKEAFCGNCFADEKPMECSEPCMDMRIILDAPTIIPASEEVYDKYTDTAGNLHWTGTHSGEHTIKAKEGENWILM